MYHRAEMWEQKDVDDNIVNINPYAGYKYMKGKL